MLPRDTSDKLSDVELKAENCMTLLNDKEAEQKGDQVRKSYQPSNLPGFLFFFLQHLNYFDTNLAVLPVEVLSFGGQEEREFLEHIVWGLTACNTLDTLTNHFHQHPV